MSVLTTGRFWVATGERAVKTAAQGLVLAIGVNVVTIDEINWSVVGGAAALGALLSVATSLASIPVGGNGPSLGPEELTPKG